MNKLKRETTIIDMWVTKPISEEAINEAVYLFRQLNIDYPEQLVMHPDGRYELLAQLKMQQTDINTYIGMTIIIDRDFEKYEWCVRTSQSKTTVIE